MRRKDNNSEVITPCHFCTILGKGCNTLLMSADFSTVCFGSLSSCVDMPQDLSSSVIDHTYIMHLVCARLTLLMHACVYHFTCRNYLHVTVY